MSGLAFPLRLAARTLVVAGAPYWTRARDQLSHYEKEPPHSPVEALGEFLLESLLDTSSAKHAEEMQRFLEHVLPAASRLYAGRAWLQFSAASGERGVGLAIFNDKRSIAERFFSYLAAADVAGEAVEFARALCEPFPASAYGQLRAEFRAGAPTRFSLFPGWVLEPWRGHGGFERVFARLPAALREQPRIAYARALARLQAPELYPYGLGVSFGADAREAEFKLYTTRYDARRSPLRGEGCLQALLETLELSAQEYARIHDLHDQLWQTAATKAIQVATSVSPHGLRPERVSLLYCGVEAEPAAVALRTAGLPESALAPLTLFRDRVGVTRPMYLGIGVDRRGLSPRIKLYDAAFFRDTDVSALGRLRPGPDARVAPRTSTQPAAPEQRPLIPRRGPVPGPGPAQLPAYALRMLHDPFKTLHGLRARYGDVVSVAGLGVPNTYFVFAPEGVQRMFRDNAANYVRGQNFRNVGKVVGNGIVVSEGDFWRRQRKQVQPALARPVVHTQVDGMVEIIAGMLARWDGYAARGEWFDVAAEMRDVTRRITLKVMLGIDEAREASDISRTWEQVYDALTYFTTRPWQPPLDAPLPRFRRFRRAMAALDARIYQKIAEHRQDPHASGGLVRALLAARDPESGRPMTERQLRDELVTVSSAGFDTAAVTLAWTCYLLSQHPWAAHAIAREADAVFGERLPGADDIPQLGFTRQVINESMRMYPAAWVLTRTCLAADELSGYAIPAGAMTITSAWVVHYHPGHWERPEQFLPERFDKQHSAGRSRFAFFPFGDGPRKCPGDSFALAEITAAVALLCQRFALRMKPGHPVALEPSFTLRPRHGLMMRAEPRLGRPESVSRTRPRALEMSEPTRSPP